MAVNECAICGYRSDKPLDENKCPDCGMTFWKYRECGHILKAQNIPEQGPSCFRRCELRNVTCYTPECGGPGNIDKTLL